MTDLTASTAILIPSRTKSARLPGKLLLDDTGKPLFVHTYEAAVAAKAGMVAVAAADEEIVGACLAHRVAYIRTPVDLPSGTLRVAVAAEQLPGSVALVVNLQADEPGIAPEGIAALVAAMWGHHQRDAWSVGTLVAPLSAMDAGLQSTVKAVVTPGPERPEGRALWFSRAPMAGAERHVGIYAAWRHVLESVQRAHARGTLPTRLQQAEDLEQLAWLEWGWTVGAVRGHAGCRGVDTREDYGHFIAWMRQQQQVR